MLADEAGLGLEDDAVSLSLGKAFIEVGQTVHHDVLAVIQGDDASSFVPDFSVVGS